MYASSSRTPNEQRCRRWETDRRSLHDRLPRVRHLVLIGTDRAIANGIADVDAGAGRFEQVRIEMQFSAGYPSEPPRVWERSRLWPRHPDRHLYPDGEFCLGLPRIDLPVTATPHDFEKFLGQLLVFLHDQFIFDATRKWPGPEWDHGYEAAFTQFVCETLDVRTERQARGLGALIQQPRPQVERQGRCPCGSGSAYLRCHAPRVGRVRSVRRLQAVPDLVERMVQRVNVA